MDFIWIIAGIIYVIYKLQKEEHIFTLKGVSIFVAFFLLQFILRIIAYNIGGETALTITALITFNIPVLVLCIWGIATDLSWRCKESQNYKWETAEDLQRHFKACGFNNVSANQIDKLIKSPFSPLNGNRGKVLVTQCYSWLCQEATWDIMRKSDKELGETLGVPINEIPLDPKAESGLNTLKRQALARNYILRREGLRYKGNYVIRDEYYDFFDKFVEDYIKEHQVEANQSQDSTI